MDERGLFQGGGREYPSKADRRNTRAMHHGVHPREGYQHPAERMNDPEDRNRSSDYERNHGRGPGRRELRSYEDVEYQRDRDRFRDREFDHGDDRRRARDWDREYSRRPDHYERDYDRRHESNYRDARHDNRGYYERDRDRDDRPHGLDREDRPVPRDRPPPRRETVSSVLCVKGLPLDKTEGDLADKLRELAASIVSIRVIRDRTSGASRGYAFVEFDTVESAQDALETTGRLLDMDGARCFIEYSMRPNDIAQDKRQRADWVCAYCQELNFARRQECYACGKLKQVQEGLEATDGARDSDSSSRQGAQHWLVVNGLEEQTSEEILHYHFSRYAPIKELRIVRDKFTHISKGFGFIQFHSFEDADTARRQTDNHKLEGQDTVLRVSVSHSGLRWQQAAPNRASAPASSAAAEAIAAASMVGYSHGSQQLAEHPRHSATLAAGPAHTESQGKSMGFQYDPKSGYYYDVSSGFYYDAARQLYYHGLTQKWFTWDAQAKSYVPAEAPPGTSAKAQSDQEGERDQPAKAPKEKKKEKSTSGTGLKAGGITAKKIGNDMVKWNKRKEDGDAKPLAEAPFVMPIKKAKIVKTQPSGALKDATPSGASLLAELARTSNEVQDAHATTASASETLLSSVRSSRHAGPPTDADTPLMNYAGGTYPVAAPQKSRRKKAFTEAPGTA